MTTLAEPAEDLLARRARLLGPSYRLFYDAPVHLVRGERVWLWDADGNRYLDMYNNVPCVGHCHPRVVEALSRAAATLNTHTRYLHEGVLALAETLLATMPREIGNVMFTCTGSEANDLAIRVAKSATGGTGVIVTSNAYHGVTETIAGMSPSLGAGVPLGAGVYTVPAPPADRDGVDVAETFADGVRAALARMAQDGVRPAALLVDDIFSSDGVFFDPPGFLAPAVEAVRAAGGIYIADEVQPGFGRTGVMWGFTQHGLVPDLITMGKPMGNGHPIAAMAARPALLEAFGRQARYFNTFGGNTVSTAVAKTVLDVIADERLAENAAVQGAYLRQGLKRLAQRHALLGDIRGAGLFLGLEIVSDRATHAPAAAETKLIVNGLRNRGVLIGSAGPQANVLKVRPPLPLRQEEADFFLSALDETLAAVS
ncbi:aspartate aminotransferase family protein [Limobrevibacterium gyesilva]|uniref:Aspartate aminotransferase family protein n=1 Tax=Limobrevibacterium gyesilva TaxID=2991712 RepID=A0AA41YL02_9PROT|nr:aspartate aminotransferase family protein [Limobrevibacterium gyesilva]MCW3474326.1 aspartate aminotransferase family protein [Limobrevibacterium gyesilva]